MALPVTVSYGRVKWRAISAVADGADVDANPDAVPVTGTVTFAPSAPLLLSAADPPITVFAVPVTYELDATGTLVDSQGRTEITLVADSPGLNPAGWTWSCTYKLNGGLTRGSFSFSLQPGQLLDLTTVAPLPASGGASIVVGPEGPSAYDVAVANGYVGTEAEWLASLVGATGGPGPAGVGVPAAGLSGQVLAKVTAADYDTGWADAATGGGTVSDATATTKGVLALAGDLSGTAALPTVPGLAGKAAAADLTAHTGATTAAHGGLVAATDPALTNARTPLAHKATHAVGGTDALTPAAIGAAAAADLAAKADLVAGLVPTSQIPALAVTTAVPVADQAAMLALGGQVQRGDVAVRADGAGSFMLVADDRTVLASWVRLDAPTDAVTSVNGQIGTVALASADVGAVPTTRSVTAGTGLTGGGALSVDQSLAVAYGTTAGTAIQGSDPSRTNARTPTAHQASHAAGGTDAVTPASISAVLGGSGITAIVKMTQVEYDALATKVSTTLYVIEG